MNGALLAGRLNVKGGISMRDIIQENCVHWKYLNRRLAISVMTFALLLVSVVVPADAQRRNRHRRGRPSMSKHIAVGTAVGAVGGALVGGGKGALLGGGAGAGTGYLVYRH